MRVITTCFQIKYITFFLATATIRADTMKISSFKKHTTDVGRTKEPKRDAKRKFNGWERDGDSRRVTLCFKLFHVVSSEEDDSKLLGLKVLTKADGAPDLIARILVDYKKL